MSARGAEPAGRGGGVGGVDVGRVGRQSERPPPAPGNHALSPDPESQSHVAPWMLWPRCKESPPPVTTKRPTCDLHCTLHTATDSPTMPHMKKVATATEWAGGTPRARGTWREVLEPGPCPDVAEGQYYTTIVLLSMDSLKTPETRTENWTTPTDSASPLSPARRNRPPSPLCIHGLGAV